MRVLGIETSCDETSASVVEDGTRVRSNIIASSRDTFQKSGGVIPEQAARQQVACMLPVITQALEHASITHTDLDALAVTRGPGLLGSLLVGTTTARVLGDLWNLPVIGVHHTLGHLSSTWLDTSVEDAPLFPCLTLSASGGHTELWYRTSHLQGTLIGRTRDDAAGEAFDKGAHLLGLPYPGGPAISRTAKDGNIHAFSFPLPLGHDEALDFSFSGLKTALRYIIRDLSDADRTQLTAQGNQLKAHSTPLLSDLAASFEHAICRHLLDRVSHALVRYPDVRELHIVGGVSANTRLRSMATELAKQPRSIPLRVRTPVQISYCTDNAAMIAAAGTFRLQEEGTHAHTSFETHTSLPLEEAVR